MNIHFKDKELLLKLEQATLFKGIIGSHLYGTNYPDSDFDYLNIYIPSINEENTFKQSHHQLQYKGINEDLNFCSLDVFLTNLLNGDSVVNFEIVNSVQLLNTPLEYLYVNRYDFYNYKVLRSYLGIARRDLKEIGKQNTLKYKASKLAHAYRGYSFARKVMGKEEIFPIDALEKFFIMFYKEIEDEKIISDFRSSLDEKISNLRRIINEKLDEKTLFLPNFMELEKQLELDKWLLKLKQSDFYKNKMNWEMDLTEFHKLNEDVIIKYDKN